MKTTRTLYILAWLLPLMLIGMHLAEIIKPAMCCGSDLMAYALSLTTIALSLTTAYLAMKMLALPRVKRKMQNLPAEQKEKFIQTLLRLRIVAILAVILIDFAAFYLCGSSSPLYLAAMMGVALLFCWPQHPEK